MLLLSPYARRPRRGFTLVEMAIGMAIFAVVAMAVMAAAMRAYKEAEDTNRFLAAHSLALSMLQQVTSAPGDRQAHITNGISYEVYDSEGQKYNLPINGATPVTISLHSTLDQGQRHVSGSFDVNIFLTVTRVSGYRSYQITVTCDYGVTSGGGERSIAISAFAPNTNNNAS
ncbi:MAG: prepilin-type N-terminal cleavage/methylation domain-containing protein [Verrucomicrobiota bacterium JB022]|nr:prepilin-type N-terminal cleavage/methylation domain-containing protein [Verrucomicrobiota bacterium JB022]